MTEKTIERKGVASLLVALVATIALALSTIAIAAPTIAIAADSEKAPMETVKSEAGTWQEVPVRSLSETDNYGGVSKDVRVAARFNPKLVPEGSDVFVNFVYGGYGNYDDDPDVTFDTWGFFTVVVDGVEVEGEAFIDLRVTFLRVPVGAENASIDPGKGVSGFTYASADNAYKARVSDANGGRMIGFVADGDTFTFMPANYGRPGAAAEFKLIIGERIDPYGPDAPRKVMHRLYNPNSGEHFYTASDEERDVCVDAGWTYEGFGWYAPVMSGAPVHRLYNPNSGDHHYTMSAEEKDALVGFGWSYEGVGWNSADESDGVPLYREYNPNATTGTHNYTASEHEHSALVNDLGWNDEGIGWYGLRDA